MRTELKHWKFWTLLLCMSFVMLSGGCGGGGGGGSSDPIPTPDPNVDFAALGGTWIWSDGTGTASGYGYNFELRLNAGGTIFEMVDVTNTEAVMDLIAESYWDVYNGSEWIDEIGLGTYDGDEIRAERRLVKRTGTNSFQCSALQSTGDSNIIDVTFISDTRAYVKERGIFPIYYSNGSVEKYNFDITFYMEKQ